MADGPETDIMFLENIYPPRLLFRYLRQKKTHTRVRAGATAGRLRTQRFELLIWQHALASGGGKSPQ